MRMSAENPAATPCAVRPVWWLRRTSSGPRSGCPPCRPSPTPLPTRTAQGFPAWLRVTHYVNFLFIILLVRSGLQILMDHPRLYWNVHCTPGTEWLRLTPVEVPKDRVWTAKDDSRYLSPWIGLPGYRHTIGMARHWHFLSVLFWVAQRRRLRASCCSAPASGGAWCPTSWQIVPDAWAVFVHYATFHLPPEPDGFYRYNPLQQLAYFAVVFVLAPLAILTGPSMSPALTNRFKWYPKLPGNRQVGRSLHFLVMCAFVIFLVVHVTMVALTGFARNMNHIVVGTDDTSLAGVYLGLVGVGVIVAVNALANWLAWRQPRLVQHVAKAIVTPVMSFLLDRAGSAGRVPPRGHLPVLLGQRQGAHLRGVEDAGGRQLQGLPAEGVRPGGEPGRAVAGRPPGAGQEDADHAAPLHPGLVGHRRVGRPAAGRADSSWSGRGPMQRRSSSTPSAKASRSTRASRAFDITTASRSRTPCTRRPCWPTR